MKCTRANSLVQIRWPAFVRDVCEGGRCNRKPGARRALILGAEGSFKMLQCVNSAPFQDASSKTTWMELAEALRVPRGSLLYAQASWQPSPCSHPTPSPHRPRPCPPWAAPFVRSEAGSWELQWDLASSYGTEVIPGGVEGLKSDFS